MGHYNVPPDLLDVLKDLKSRTQALVTSQAPRVCTLATRPTVAAGVVVFVTDAAAGSKFQGWDGTAWVPLG